MVSPFLADPHFLELSVVQKERGSWAGEMVCGTLSWH